MGKVGGVLMGIVGVVLGLILIANPLPDVIDDTVTEAYSEPYEVTTGVGETSTEETLTYDHYYGDLEGLTATSSIGGDDPVVLTYETVSQNVTVGGLQASETRILTVAYYREGYTEFTGFAPFVRFIPLFLVIGLVVVALWAIFSRLSHRGRE